MGSSSEMCRLSRLFKLALEKPKTVEEIIAENSAGMTDEQKAQYWYELSQNIFALLGKVDAATYEIGTSEWLSVAQGQYPTLTDVKLADWRYFTTDLEGITVILKRDWTNLVPYVAELSDCDDFAIHLHSHLILYYKITGIVPVWGDTDGGRHAFNLAVLKDGNAWIARLIEPQSDKIFVDSGPLGRYVPRETARMLAVKKIPPRGGR
jgi:predicted phosphodiesterase